MKKIYLLLILLFTFVGCQKEELQSLPEENIIQNKNKELINFKDLPPSVLNKFDNENLVKNKAFKNNSPFGAVNTKVPAIKDIDDNGTISYTMELKKSKGANKLKAETDLYFDNFVINQKENGKENIYIIRYLPERTWYFQGANNFSNYTGEIRIFDAQGKALGETRVKNGTDTAQTDIANAKIITCSFALKGTLCVGGMYGEPLSCKAIYDLDSCSSDTGGGDTSGDPNQYEGSTPEDTSTGSSGDPDTITTDPIIEEPCYTAEGFPALRDSSGNCIILEDTNFELYKIDSDSLTGKEKCLNDLLDKEGDSYVQELLENFRGDSEFDIKIESKDNLYGFEGDPVNGLTFEPFNNIINIQISTNAATSRPALGVVRTILHEYIHADMFRKLNTLVDNQTTDILNFKDTYESFKNNNFEADPQHETMAALYIDEMTRALKDFHKNALVSDYNYLTDNGANPLPDSFYEALAWQGLTQEGEVVDAYNQLSDEKKAELRESLSLNYHSTTTNCPENN